MYRRTRLAGVSLGVALLVVLVVGGSSLAQGTESAQLQLTPSRDSGVSGTASIKQVEGGVQVKLYMKGLPEPGVEHANHFHQGGTCADDRAGRPAPATIPLKTIVAKDDGTGSGTTTLKDVTLDQLFDESKQRYIAFHNEASGKGVPPVIACADVVRTTGDNAAVGALPNSGGKPPMVVVLSIVVFSVLGGAAGWLTLWRRITY